MGDFNAEVSETSFSSFSELYEVKKHYQPVDLLQKPYKFIVYRPIPNKLTKQFPEINNS